MSESLNSREREWRAFDALIVSNLQRDRDITDLDDLPKLTDSERIAMNALPNDFVDRLWDSVDDTNVTEYCETPDESRTETELFAGANRAEGMDEETFKKLEAARNLAREVMRKKKQQGRNDAPPER